LNLYYGFDKNKIVIPKNEYAKIFFVLIPYATTHKFQKAVSAQTIID